MNCNVGKSSFGDYKKVFLCITPYSTNYMILDKHEIDAATRIRVLNESSDEAIAEGATISRTNVVPKDTTALTDDTFGFTETFEFFPQGKTYDPVADTDS